MSDIGYYLPEHDMADPFYESPHARVFLAAAAQAWERTGDSHISPDEHAILALKHGLTHERAAALAYLAGNRVLEHMEELEVSLLARDVRGYTHDWK